MHFLKIVVVMVTLFVQSAESQVTMRPLHGECSPFSLICESCVAAQCTFYEMDRNYTRGDLCWPPYMSNPMRAYTMKSRTTVEECLDYIRRIPPAVEEENSREPEQNPEEPVEKLKKPEIKPEEPVENPEEPVEKPEEREKKPEEPAEPAENPDEEVSEISISKIFVIIGVRILLTDLIILVTYVLKRRRRNRQYGLN